MSDSKPNDFGVEVEVRGLHKHFGSQHVLKGVDLTIQPGELFVIMGPSGSGKSVLLKSIMGLEEPDHEHEYTLTVGGRHVPSLAGQIDINEGDQDEECRIAMVFQSGALLNSLTVGENVGLYLSEHRQGSPAEIEKVVAEKLAVVGLSGAEDKRPDQLSGGMKRRVALARALVIDPHLILYDEPTSELDPLISITIGREILRLNKKTGATSVVVTHDRDLAFGIANRMALMQDGELVVVGTPDEVRNSPDPRVQRFLTADFSTDDSN